MILNKKNYQKMCKFFFGTFKPPKLTITTPISKIFEAFDEKYEVKLLNSSTKILNTNILLAKIPQGEASYSYFRVLGHFNTIIINLGFCYAIDKNLQIGEIVALKCSKYNNKMYYSKLNLKTPETIKKVSGLTIPHMMYVFETRKDKLTFYQVVDMETGILYKVNPFAITLNIVSDTLYKKFFDLSRNDVKKILRKVKDLVLASINICKNIANL